ncbi:MAG: phytanoyl-CoA dioxygenase family protein [Opitutaceae bacterium]|nr:phytanoyl-CoA dioxygenase family protein [Opitutaceae bacterium]
MKIEDWTSPASTSTPGASNGNAAVPTGTPYEFTAEAIEAASADAFTPYRDFLSSGEPYRSLLRNNPWMKPPSARDELEWGKGWYYDTTVARKHPHWRSVALPQATKDLRQLRKDFYEWGFCLIENGLSPEQCTRLHERVAQQAAAERALGLAHLSPAQQHVWALVNKGADFVKCMEHAPDAVQAGPLIEKINDEVLGAGWNHFSFISNISFPGCYPQGLHQDQSFMAPYNFPEAPAPVLVNTIYILQDVDEVNGGTLIVPGSHRKYRNGETFGAIPPPINLEARAGVIMLMDGRVLHGGAVNRSDKLRYIITNSVVKPWVKQQESFLVTVSPEVLAKASPKFLWRAGFQSTAVRNMVEGYGYRGNVALATPTARWRTCARLRIAAAIATSANYRWTI